MTTSVTRTLIMVGLIALMEPISATMLFPFVYFMVKDFDPSDVEHIGLRAGLVTTAFFIPQMITTIPYGIISDRYGRKPVLLAGLIGSAVFLGLFGLSRSLPWAIASRVLCGFFNGNSPITRTVAGEIADRAHLNQGKVFAIFGLTGALGYVVGPMIGGALAKPAELYGLRGPGNIFGIYPYLLPCLIGTLMILTVTIISLFLLEETNDRVLRKDPGGETADEIQPLLPSSIVSDGKRHGLLSRSMIAMMVSILFMCLHAIAFDEGLPVFLASPSTTSPPVGLGFTSAQIARTLSCMSPVLLLTQFVGYPMLSRHFPPLSLWRWSAFIYIVFYPLFSLLPRLTAPSVDRPALWVVLMFIMTGRFAANVVAYTSMAVMLNQMSPPGKKGTTMGMAQTGMSLGRAVGPALGGMVWSWSLSNGLPFPFDSHALFYFLAVLGCLQGISSLWITKVASAGAST
ncbi:MFS general substrate transporter [Aspergillus sclerotioniger CBS 115572]|uniref:MFS general substrate transporter n=1 Tax=Aspergillus sclerotioniger CBS 115572 TaxID=1450535 RepID=A0A317XBY0_9EURO|nr:MFS general substrate transporter [Aspergillus sclerotioniger CBS 115572]PWY95192.1 MFS general substrate transporter [Aspergillus sclerotioniger CBS 115572]